MIHLKGCRMDVVTDLDRKYAFYLDSVVDKRDMYLSAEDEETHNSWMQSVEEGSLAPLTHFRQCWRNG